MNIDIPADLETFVDAAISSGGFKNKEEVVGEALRLLRQRLKQTCEQLRGDVNAGFEELAAGAATEYDEPLLASRFEAIKAAGRQRLNDRPLDE